MKLTRWRTAVVGAGVALLAAAAAPAQAVAGTPVITDANGNDLHPVTVAGPATTADGTAEGVDILSVKLETVVSNGQDRLRATVVIDGTVPAEGPGLPTDMDTDSPFYVGGGYRVLFNNLDKQHNGDNTATGCARTGGGRVRDQGGHWADGYYNYIGLGVAYDGTGWSHTPEIGEYDPSPDGGFFFTDLESEPNMDGKFSSSVTASGGDTTIVVEVAGVVETGDTLCVGGVFKEDYASDDKPGPYSGAYAGDRIANVNGLTTEDVVVVLPVTIPASVVPGESDIKAIGGWVFQSDTTPRTNGTPVYSPGPLGDLASVDNLGDTASCPTPTVGGTAPDNPVWAANQNQPCQLDDDVTGNSVLVEYRQSGFNFTANF